MAINPTTLLALIRNTPELRALANAGNDSEGTAYVNAPRGTRHKTYTMITERTLEGMFGMQAAVIIGRKMAGLIASLVSDPGNTEEQNAGILLQKEILERLQLRLKEVVAGGIDVGNPEAENTFIPLLVSATVLTQDQANVLIAMGHQPSTLAFDNFGVEQIALQDWLNAVASYRQNGQVQEIPAPE